MSRFVVGVTGGIGSGKTTVVDCLARLGAGVVDTDQISRRLTGVGGVALSPIVECFGPDVLAADGALDRVLMRQRVFSDPDARRTLEAILHPMIRQIAVQECADAKAPYVLLVVPLLIETGAYRDILSRVLVIDCAENTQVVRVMARGGLSEVEVRAIVNAQASREDRLVEADDVVLNEGPWSEVEVGVIKLHEKYLFAAKM